MKALTAALTAIIGLTLGVAQADSHGSEEDLKAQISERDARIEQLSDSLRNLAAQRNKLYAQLQSGKVALAEATGAAESKDSDIQALTENRDELFDELMAKEAELAAAQSAHQEDVQALTENRDELFDELQALQQTSGDSSQRMWAKIKDLRGELVDTKAALQQSDSKAETDAERMQNHILGLYDKRDSLQDQLADSQQQLADLQNSSEANSERMENHILGLYDQRDSLKQQLSDVTNEKIDTLERENRTLSNVNGSAKRMLTSTREQLAETKASLADSERKVRTLTNVNASAKRMLTSSREQLEEAKATVSAAESVETSPWAEKLTKQLTGKLDQLQGTEVFTAGVDTVRVRVGNNGLFQSGGIQLTDAGKQLLWVIGDAVEAAADTRMTIEGHTDNIPLNTNSRFANNWELSFARASSALAHMRTNVGIPPERMSVAGASDTFPIASNSTAAGREQNRRVEIVLTPLR